MQTLRTFLRSCGRRGMIVGVVLALILGYGYGRLTRDEDQRAPVTAGATARLVPDDALVYVALRTDGDNETTEKVLAVARQFPGWDQLRDRTVRSLLAAGRAGVAAKDVAPFLGDEAAIAFVDRGTATAGSLVIVEVTDAKAATRFLDQNRRTARVGEISGVATRTYGSLVTAIVDDTLLLGQRRTVEDAIALSQKTARSLAAAPGYKAAVTKLPRARAALLFSTTAGIRRLIAPQANSLGILGAAIDQPGLRAAAVALSPNRVGLRFTLRRVVVRQAQRGQAKPFAPALATAMPENTFAFVTLKDASRLAQSLAPLVAGNEQATELLLAAQKAGALRLLRGEVGIGLLPGSPTTLLLVASVTDERAAARTVRALKPPLLGALKNGRIAIASKPAGLRAALRVKRSLAETKRYQAVVGDRSARVSSIVFLDTTQLLSLGEQSGLRDSRDYLAVAPDLKRVRAIGIRSTTEEGASTSEITLLSP